MGCICTVTVLFVLPIDAIVSNKKGYMSFIYMHITLKAEQTYFSLATRDENMGDNSRFYVPSYLRQIAQKIGQDLEFYNIIQTSQKQKSLHK